ncbi:MAG: heavy metal translocating P-type ATPase [Clostridia bacterium]|nr:heavy metal translocating P-type ATPase [Clostridia bacterium]
MKKYSITGMSCAACSARVEKAVSAVEGIESCSVNLLTNSMNIEGDASDATIIKAVTDAGYGAERLDKSANKEKTPKTEDIAEAEISMLKKRLFASLGFLIALMYISMGSTMWGWPLPETLSENFVAQGILQLVLSGIIMVINQRFFISGFKAFAKRAPNMDTLVALGASAAFGYSLYVLLAMTAVHDESGHLYMHDFYFESAGMILTLITVGKLLEARSKGRTADALKSLISLTPKTAVVIRDGVEKTIPVDELKVDDIFAVRPGESIPADGVVIEGTTAIDESALTGESIPVDKMPGDMVTGATVNRLGFVKCKTTRIAEDTTLAQIIKLVTDASSSKAPVSKAADKVSGIFVPVVMTVAAITFVVWLLLGQTLGFAVARGISVLVISCPCALGLATPVAIMVGNGVGAKNGVLFKTAASLEEMGKVKIAALDKTGTITKGEPRVTDIFTFENISEEELLRAAVSLEIKSEHPLAEAIVKKAKDSLIEAETADDFEAIPGNGVVAQIDGIKFAAGSIKFIQTCAEIPDVAEKTAIQLAKQGKTPLFFAREDRLIGIIAVSDTIKDDSKDAVEELKNLGIRVVMITGDNEKTAKAIATQTGIDEVVAGVLPDGKSDVLKELMKHGKVAMVGDGINDAPALATANVGVAIGAGSDVAVDAADVVLMKNSICDVAAAIRLSRATLTNIYENLFWAFVYNVIGIPLASGVFIPVLGWQLNPMFGAAAMSLSSFCVVTNALRLNFTKVYKRKTMIKNDDMKEEIKIMKRIMKIEGMMCPHCEANVKTALEGLEKVIAAEVNHKEGTAVVIFDVEIENDVLKQAVEDKGYKVVSVE